MSAAATSSSVAMKRSISALRAHIRYLTFRGLCAPTLAEALPSVAPWRLSAVPRYLPPAQVETLLAACGRWDPRGVRDYAIRLLLARLGLRAADIRSTEIYLRGDANTKLEMLAASSAPVLTPGRFRAPDKLLTMLAESWSAR